jgi:hypothetical protein
MSKRRIKITESQYKRISQRLDEAGGYDDQGTMAFHGGSILNGLEKIVNDIASIVETTRDLFQQNTPKEDIMGSMNGLTSILDQMKIAIKKIAPEIVNDELKAAAKELYTSINKAENKLRILANSGNSFINPNMPPAMTGMGFSMGQNDFADMLTDILVGIGNKAAKLKHQIELDTEQIQRRLSTPPDDYGLN